MLEGDKLFVFALPNWCRRRRQSAGDMRRIVSVLTTFSCLAHKSFCFSPLVQSADSKARMETLSKHVQLCRAPKRPFIYSAPRILRRFAGSISYQL